MSVVRPPIPSRTPQQVALFVTCVVDQLWPEIAESTVRVLRRAGVEVVVPLEQTCCGQVAWNSGFRAEARQAAHHFLTCFEEYEAVVTPSGSCAAMVRGQLAPLLGAEDEGLAERATALAERTWELSEFLGEVMGLRTPAARFPAKVAYHPSCHLLRELGGGQGERLLRGLGGLELLNQEERTECCGFGGLFSLRQPEVSGALLQSKCGALEASGAEVVVSTDASCLLHIGGGLRRRRAEEAPEVLHLAQVLDRALSESSEG